MYVCVYVYMYVCIYIYVFMYVCMYVGFKTLFYVVQHLDSTDTQTPLYWYINTAPVLVYL